MTTILKSSLAAEPVAEADYYVCREVEPVVELLRPSEAWVVENHYGSQVLVTRGLSALPLVDVDGPGSLDIFAVRLCELELFPHMQLRCYRTAGGWRLLVVSQTLTPEWVLFALLHRGMGGDERYLQLCKRQRTFRARLSPKPSRLALREKDVAACRFAGTIGGGKPDGALLELVEFHDQRTRALEEGHLRLA
jgi:hypothetical protein